jgi:hypothetical protein
MLKEGIPAIISVAILSTAFVMAFLQDLRRSRREQSELKPQEVEVLET